MISSSWNRNSVLTVLCSAAFLVGFPVSLHYAPGGSLFGILLAVPVVLIAWRKGFRIGLVAAISGIIYVRTLFSLEYFLVRHNTVDSFWILSAIETSLAFLVIGGAVGKLSDSLRALKTAVTAREKAEAALQSSHAHLEAILTAVPDLMFEVDRDGRFYEMPTPNPHRLLVPPEMFIAKTVREILPEHASAVAMGAIAGAAKTGSDAGATYRLTMDGDERWFELSISAIGDHGSPDAHFVALARDITERVRMEQHAERVRKMEAIGRLAGGIAHDVNNILQVILGSCDLIRERGDDGETFRKSLAVIISAVKRAATLTSQLLSFSQMQVVHPVVSDLNAFLRAAEGSVRETLGTGVELSLRTQSEAAWVRADPAQLRELIVHLTENARDAMPAGGTLCVETYLLQAAPGSVDLPGAIPRGEYAVLTVRDTGNGMDGKTLSHAFEPFYTTKEFGRGGGLGLSIVHGIVTQMGGHVSVTSHVGEGTTFRVYLPLAKSTESSGLHAGG